ncbi:MAG: alpha/beta hydrolase [Lachnospiraceae bacterium]|nr:alpha/beta hydrolase [Lachnospiraceae bacterium]
MSIAIETVKTDDVLMDYFRFGKKGGYPVFIIPGLSIKSVMESADLVAAAYAPMTDEFDIYVMDRRKNIPEEYSIENMAEDTIKAVKKIGFDSVNIVSTSQGGMISMCMALKAPELVNSMIIMSSSSHHNEKSDAVIKNWIDLAKSGDREKLMVDFAEKCYTKNYVNTYLDVFKKMSALVTDEELKRFVIVAKDILSFDISDMIQKIKCNTLVVAAEDDLVFGKETSLEIAEKLGCEYYVYQNYGHAFYDEAPDCIERVHKYFKSVI